MTMLVLTGLMLAMPFAVRYLIDDLVPRLVAEVKQTGSVDMWPIIWFGAFLIGVYLSYVLFGLVRDYLAGKVGASIIADMRSQLFDHLSRVPLRFYQETNIGEIMSRLMSDVQRVQGLLTVTFLMLLTNILMLLAVFVVILVVDWKLTLVAIIPVPLTIFLSSKFGRKLHGVTRVLQETIAKLSGRLQETFSAMRTIRAFAQERRESRRVGGVLHNLIGLYVKNSVLNSLASNLVHFVNMVAPIVILSWGTYLIAGGSLTLGALMMFYMLVSYLYSPVQDLATVNVEIQSSMAAVNRIFEYLDIREDIPEDPNPIAPAEVRGEIAFDHVGFAYSDNGFRMDDLVLSIGAGEKVAIVGPSGSGKTTLINLLLRFFDPQRGQITIDGKDIRRLALKTLRSKIGLVDQEPILFKASIRENISYGDPDADFDRVVRAARIANIHDFISHLPKGYDHEVGERGVTLSGGERQRICLARALLKNPPIVLLDEATSALDTRSEQLIQDALEEALKDKTAIIIAHRLATVRHADRIVAMENGRIADQGTHEELLKRSPLYRELAKKQLRI